MLRRSEAARRALASPEHEGRSDRRRVLACAPEHTATSPTLEPTRITEVGPFILSGASARSSLEEVPRRLERLHEHINFLGCVVAVEAGACGARNAERSHKRLSAVVSRSDCHAVVIEYCADVVRMEVAEVEG